MDVDVNEHIEALIEEAQPLASTAVELLVNVFDSIDSGDLAQAEDSTSKLLNVLDDIDTEYQIEAGLRLGYGVK